MKKIKPYLTGIWYSLPVQLFLLHFKRYQVLLLFWFILFATINGNFMLHFGANMLYLYPEYLGNVNSLSLALVGAGVAVFIMSWNITTFILHAKHIRFLATTTQPFLKYCLNNGLIPVTFLLFYFFTAVRFDRMQELLSYKEIFLLAGGFLAGFVIAISIAFTYFFGADKTIYRFMHPDVKEELQRHKNKYQSLNSKRDKSIIRVDWYLSATFKLRKPRSVKHYSASLIDQLFKQHHLVALFSILIAFISLIITGFFLDNIYFQLPAAASITVLFAILIAVAGAFSYFLESWALVFVLAVFLGLNLLYKNNILDPRNKAYGVNYGMKSKGPVYSRDALNAVANKTDIAADSLAYIEILNRWKARQTNPKPVFMIASVSGGGNRATAFTLNVLRGLDSVPGAITKNIFMISGASGGMIGAAWYRELLYRQQNRMIDDVTFKRYVDDITADLLNPLFSSLIARDLLSPPQRFRYKNVQYIKDRGYAFEERLNSNTHGFLNKSLADYRQAEDSAIIPRLFINAVITRDGRKLLMASRPSRFMMRPFGTSENDNVSDVDAVDFASFFSKQDAHNLRILTALRMNATFPYVLPNVWLPSNPVIDVMDAGFRDNTGIETGLKFLHFFRSWLQENCSQVVMIQISDKRQGGWDNPFESKNILDMITKPAFLTQNNLFRFQEYAQLTEVDWFKELYGEGFHRVLFTYHPSNKESAASLSFHLTQREKRDLKISINNPQNKNAFEFINRLLK